MTLPTQAMPLTQTQILDRYFLEHRSKLLDIAAFLDRVDRARPETHIDTETNEDFRLDAFRAALKLLTDNKPQRTKRILEELSDPTDTPAAAADGKGAVGAYPPIGSKSSSSSQHHGDTR